MALATSVNPIVAALTVRDTELADLGAFYTVTNPTLGTAIAGHAAPTTFDQTKALLYFYNAGNANIYPANLRLKLTAAATNSTTVRFTQVIDKGADRFSSGGSALIPLNTNIASANASGIANFRFGAVVLAANSAVSRTICDAQYRSVIGVAIDTYSFVWGAETTGVITSQATNGTNPADIYIGYPPIVIPPGAMFAIHQWSASQSGAPSFEFEFDYFEK